MTRGSTAAGTIRTHVLADRITRASCFVCADAAAAIALARWIEAELPAMRDVARPAPTTRRSPGTRACAR